MCQRESDRVLQDFQSATHQFLVSPGPRPKRTDIESVNVLVRDEAASDPPSAFEDRIRRPAAAGNCSCHEAKQPSTPANPSHLAKSYQLHWLYPYHISNLITSHLIFPRVYSHVVFLILISPLYRFMNIRYVST